MAEKKNLNLENPQFRGPTKMELVESGDGEKPFGYAGPGIYPSAEGDALMGRIAEARARAIYEAHGRNANAIARMKLDPSYAVARAAGIQLPGDGMMGTSKTASLSGGLSNELIGGGSRSTRYRDAGAAMRGAGEAKPVSYTEFAGPTSGVSETTKGTRLDTRQSPGAQTLDSLPVTQPASPDGNGMPKPPAPMADPTSTPPPAPAKPQEQKTPTVESTKGPRLTTNRSQPSRDEDMGTTRGATRDEDRRVSEISMSADANLPYDGREGPGSNQERREIAKKNYDASVQSEARKDPFAKYRTEAGDTEISQRTGEVQDRSRYGGDRVTGQKTYTNKEGREMVGNTMQRPDGSTYFVGLNSADQNKADTFNANTKGSTFNQYNNYAEMPKDYKATAEDIRANYAFGAPAGQQGPLTASPDDALGRGNRRQLEADTASYSAGSNNSRIDSRGQQSSILAGGPAEKPKPQSFSVSSPGLPFQSEQRESSPTYSGPDSGDEKKKKRAESNKPLPV